VHKFVMDAKEEEEPVGGGEAKSEAKDAPDAVGPADSKTEGQTVFERVQDFIMGDNLEKQFEDFADEHADTFMKALDFQPNDEHPLEFHNIYREYLSRFEGKIERFIEKEGLSSMAFYKECEHIIDNEEVFDMKRFFVETLLATATYETFFSLMKGEMMRVKALAQRK